MQLAYNFIDVPSNFVASTSQVSSGLFNDFSTIIYLILGVLLFATLVIFIIRAFHKH